MPKAIGRELSEKWGVDAKHALYDKDGVWYHHLKDFPGALFDPSGYVLFASQDEFLECPDLEIYDSNTVHCKKAISLFANYTIGANIQAIDVVEPATTKQTSTKRIPMTVNRIVRDSPLSRRIKHLHSNQCQVCRCILSMAGDKTYSEAHHIQPLGGEHQGPDVDENIICVCPNCHAQLDYGGIQLNKSALRMVKGHVIKEEYIAYHNEVIYRSTRRGKDSSLQQTAPTSTM